MRDLINDLKFVWNYSKNEKKTYFKIIFFNIIVVILSVVSPVLSAKVVIHLTNNELEQLIFIALILFVFDITQTIIYSCGRKNIQIVYRETLKKLQIDLGKEILKIDNTSLDKNGTGVFIQRLNGDAGRISGILTSLANQLSSVVTSIGIFGAIFVVNKIAFIVMVILSAFVYIAEKVRNDIYNDNDKKIRKEEDAVSSFTGEIVRGSKDIRMLSAEDSFIKTLEKKITHYNREKYKMEKTDIKYSCFSNSTYDINSLLIILLLSFLLYRNMIIPATALVIYNYSFRATNISYVFSFMLRDVKDFKLSVSRVMEILNDSEFSKEHFGNKHLDKVDGNFEFKDVSFSYDKKKVLDKISFKVKPNETVAFVGKSGAGKTTIFNLLCKMYNVDSGNIFIDNVDINELDRKSIRDNITIISQNPYIFNLSIKDNLKLVKEDLTEEEMIKALKDACLYDYVNSLPDKYDTIVGEGGVTLSGGQRQRLAIARALVQKTEIILFDEATSALDNETQREIKEAINNLKGEYTILIIAHRLSTVIDSDRILLIEDGKVKCEGTHEELLKNSKSYNDLYSKELK